MAPPRCRLVPPPLTQLLLLGLFQGLGAVIVEPIDVLPVAYDYLPFRAPGGCTGLPLFPLGRTLDEQADQAKLDCPKYGARWAWNRTVTLQTPSGSYNVQYCTLCQPGLDQCILKWFGTPSLCKGECPAGWTPVAQSSILNDQPQDDPAYPWYGTECSSGTKVLCKLCGRKECNGCTYTWRGTAPRCYDTCDAGETVVATDRYGGGALCIGGYGHKFLCEKCASPIYDTYDPRQCSPPSDWQGTAWMCQGECKVGQYVYARDKRGDGAKCSHIYGWKVRCQTCPLLSTSITLDASQPVAAAAAGGKCYKRKCGAARRCARFTDKPALRVPGVTTYGGCCKQCRTVTGCLRFHVGPSGCAIYRTRPQAPTVRSKRFTAAYHVLAA